MGGSKMLFSNSSQISSKQQPEQEFEISDEENE
jgi:hypothetical protein